MANSNSTDASSCQYVIDTNESQTAVVIEFSELGENGIQVYTTAIPPQIALEFAESVRDFAQYLIDNPPDS